MIDRAPETDEEIYARIDERFMILEELTMGAMDGTHRSVIVSGPPGLGKSYTIDNALAQEDPMGHRHTVIKGFVRATGLFKTLWNYRHPGNIIVFDDVDSIFNDEIALNLLKAACDSTDARKISWMSEAQFEDQDGMPIDKTFLFEGTIIFLTNIDMMGMVDRGHKLAPHLGAMISRSIYLDLGMKSKRDYIIRIKQVVRENLMLNAQGYSFETEKTVLNFIEQNSDKLYELSLRMALKLAALHKRSPDRFDKMARVTCMKAA
jgi:hypothetical protein